MNSREKFIDPYWAEHMEGWEEGHSQGWDSGHLDALNYVCKELRAVLRAKKVTEAQLRAKVEALLARLSA